MKKRLRSPLVWYGGKGNMVAKLLKLIPPHRIYVEPFGGAAWLLFAKDPSPVEVYNDIDSDLVNFFRVLRDKKKFKKFYELVQLIPYSREEYKFCSQHYRDGDDVERAYRFFVCVRQSFSGRSSAGWGYSVTQSNRGMAAMASRWLSIIDELPLIYRRFVRVQIEHDDFRKIIPRYDTDETFFYCDPPYVPETLKNPKCCKYLMTLQDHEDLVALLLKVKGKVLLSGYRHDVYKPLEEAGWVRIDYETACHAAGRTRLTKILGKGAATKMQPRVESVWLNYHIERDDE